MTIHEASRTLLKSPPELWTECSNATSLSRHLDQFGEIKITRLEPETAVAWEGENVSGTVKLESSGWGTRVILTAEEADSVIAAEPEAVAEPGPVAQPEPAAKPEPEAVAGEPLVAELLPEPAAIAEPAVEPGPAVRPEDALEPEPAVAPEQPTQANSGQLQPEPEPEPKMGFFARLFGRTRKLTWPQVEPVATAAGPVGAVEPEPERAAEPQAREPEPEPAPEPEPEPAPEPQARAPEPEPTPEVPGPEPATERKQTPDATIRALTDALESLGMAHHRPFSRS
jgi:hypothetical protein